METSTGTTTCMACGSTAREKIGPTFGGFYERCLSCGLEARVISESAVEDFETAQREYYGDAYAFEAPHFRHFMHKLAGARLRRIQRHLQTGRILEVGPGGGQLLRMLRDRGFSVEAVEHSPEVARRLREELRVPVTTGAFETADLPVGGLDAILSMHVIEHVPSPLAHLRRACELVRPGGYLFLATPNLDAWSRRVAGCRWCAYSNAHIFLFTPASMKACIEQTGWRLAGGYSIESAYGWPRAIRGILRTPGRAYPPSPGLDANRRLSSSAIAAATSAFGVVSWPARAVQSVLGGGDELFVVACRAE